MERSDQSEEEEGVGNEEGGGSNNDSNENEPLQSVNGGNESRNNVVVAKTTTITTTKPRPHRKKSCLPQIELEEYNWRKADTSPGGSFRKKFVFTVPGVMKQEQPREYKLKAFVVFLFFLIIIYIALTYVFHKQQQLQLLQLELGERIHFREESQVLRILNRNRQEILVGQLGKSIPNSLSPYKCSADDNRKERCLEWKHSARLRIDHLPRPNNSTRCYSVVWESLSDVFQPLDCFSLGDASWYGIGELNPQEWQLERLNFSMRPFFTGDGSSGLYGSVVERYWLSSKAIAILVGSSNQLYVSMSSGELCFGSTWNLLDRNPSLNYTMCTSWDMNEVHNTLRKTKFPPIPSLDDNMEAMIKGVVWTTTRLNSTNGNDVFEYVENLLEYKGPLERPGIVLITGGWQEQDGDLRFDPQKFENSAKLVSIRHKGFKMALAVHPYISTSSSNYMDGIEERRWVMDPTETVPALTRWRSMKSAAILDFTNNRSQEWFLAHLENLLDTNMVDGFFFEGGESYYLPKHYALYDTASVADKYGQLYAKTAVESGAALSISSCANCQNLPVFITLTARDSTWDKQRGLQSIIPAILSLGMSGYAFVNPGTVGGEYFHLQHHQPVRELLKEIEKNMTQNMAQDMQQDIAHNMDRDMKQDTELYIRWFQVSTFLPVLQLSVAPRDMGEKFDQLARKLIAFRATVVIPRILRLAHEATLTGLPIVRPLWSIAPNDSIAIGIDSQFLLGDDFLVAPVLEKGASRRNVYLPEGLWVFQETRQIYTGSRWINVDAPLNEVPYFLRINTTEARNTFR